MNHAILRAALTLILVVVVSLVGIAGCKHVERAAQDIQYIAQGEAPDAPAGEETTPPRSAGVEAARGAVEVAAAINPAVGQIASVVGLIAGAVAGVAGHFNGKRSGRKQAHTVIAEIVDDVAAFRDPSTPWTDDTRKLLTDLGYTEAAAVVPTINVTEFFKK